MEVTKENELAVWRQSRGGDIHATRALLRSVMPYVQKRVSRYRDVPIPYPALYGEATKMALSSFQSWDPSRGARLGTHVVTQLQRMNRFVQQNKNIARIPEHRIVKIGGFLHVKDALAAELGRAPSPEELADELAEHPLHAGSQPRTGHAAWYASRNAWSYGSSIMKKLGGFK